MEELIDYPGDLLDAGFSFSLVLRIFECNCSKKSLKHAKKFLKSMDMIQSLP